MAGIPVYCSYCGTVFESRGIRLMPGATGNMFAGNTETCASCGRMARIIDGIFDVSRDDVLSLVSGPTISRSILQSFAAKVEQAAKDEISADELQSEAGKLDPALGELVARVRAKHLGTAALLLIVFFLRSCDFKFEAKLDVNRLLDQWTGNGTKTLYTRSTGSDMKNSEKYKGTGNAKPSGDGPGNKDRKPTNPPK